MIFVKRGAVPIPLSLSSKSGSGASELKLAKVHYKKHTKTPSHTSTSKGAGTSKPKTFKFKAYKSQDVRAALQALFHGKCAYCESRYVATAPVDVEHYRPKAGIEGEKQHPGYWWLAAEWSNLLPSCIDCNRRRKHCLVVPDLAAPDGLRVSTETSGKANAFPIRGAVRATTPTSDLSVEDPLLIDPTTRDPDKHLSWKIANGLSVVVPIYRNGEADPYGNTTIRSFGLNRQGLVEERTRILLEVQAEQLRLAEDIDHATTLTPLQRAEFLPKVAQRLANFRRYGDDRAPYAACMSAYIKQVEISMRKSLEGLLAGLSVEEEELKVVAS